MSINREKQTSFLVDVLKAVQSANYIIYFYRTNFFSFIFITNTSYSGCSDVRQVSSYAL